MTPATGDPTVVTSSPELWRIGSSVPGSFLVIGSCCDSASAAAWRMAPASPTRTSAGEVAAYLDDRWGFGSAGRDHQPIVEGASGGRREEPEPGPHTLRTTGVHPGSHEQGRRNHRARRRH